MKKFQLKALRLAVCSVAVVASSLLIPASANAVVSPGVNVMQWNICGDDTLNCNNAGKDVTAGDALITSWHPAILMLEEVCQKQIAHFTALNGGWDSHATFFPKRTASCGTIGTAILTHQTATSPVSVTMPVATSDDGAKDTVGCVRTTVGPDAVAVEACVTHLDNDSTGVVQKKQLNGTASAWIGAAAWAQNQANGMPLVFGGDFNMTPTELSTVYTNILQYKTVQTGQKFAELDQSLNRQTHGSKKVDYLFFKNSYSKNYVAYAPVFTDPMNHGSDHAILYGQADICSSSCA